LGITKSLILLFAMEQMFMALAKVVGTTQVGDYFSKFGARRGFINIVVLLLLLEHILPNSTDCRRWGDLRLREK
jgi:hypothetical protein